MSLPLFSRIWKVCLYLARIVVEEAVMVDYVRMLVWLRQFEISKREDHDSRMRGGGYYGDKTVIVHQWCEQEERARPTSRTKTYARA